MRNRLASLLVATFLLSFVKSDTLEKNTLAPRQVTATTPPVVMGYYLNAFSDQQPPASTTMWSGYTDLVYYGARPMMSFQFTFGSDADNQRAQNNMMQFVQTTTNSKVRPLFGLGGDQGSILFSYYFKSADRRKQFVQSLVSLVQSYQFQGVALSWEFPTTQGIGCNAHDPQDLVNLGLFAQEFKTLWSDGRLVIRTSLSGFLGASGGYATAQEAQTLAQYADYIDIMAYDAFTGNKPNNMTGPFSPITTQCGQLGYSNGIKEAIQTLQSQGFATTKLILGFAAYGRLFYMPQGYNQQSGIYQNAYGMAPPGGWTDKAQGTRDACGNIRGYQGIYLTNEIVKNGWLSQDGQTAGTGLTRGFDDCSKQPYLYNNNYMLVYDDAQSSQTKSAYAKTQNLAGISIFETVGIQPNFFDAARAAWVAPTPPQGALA